MENVSVALSRELKSYYENSLWFATVEVAPGFPRLIATCGLCCTKCWTQLCDIVTKKDVETCYPICGCTKCWTQLCDIVTKKDVATCYTICGYCLVRWDEDPRHSGVKPEDRIMDWGLPDGV